MEGHLVRIWRSSLKLAKLVLDVLDALPSRVNSSRVRVLGLLEVELQFLEFRFGKALVLRLPTIAHVQSGWIGRHRTTVQRTRQQPEERPHSQPADLELGWLQLQLRGPAGVVGFARPERGACGVRGRTVIGRN